VSQNYPICSCIFKVASVRYKVKMEISLKQRVAESKPASSLLLNSMNTLNGKTISTSSSPQLSSNLEKAMSIGNMGGDSRSPDLRGMNNHNGHDELQRARTQLQEQETKWRNAVEKLAKENDLLKSKGAESVVATQWRVRYENCFRDKEELTQKLSLHSQLSSEISGDRTLEQLYMELHEEFKVQFIILTFVSLNLFLNLGIKKKIARSYA
jgi:hypothetical protein